MVDFALMSFVWILALSTFSATLVGSIPWKEDRMTNEHISFFIDPRWIFPALFFVAWHIGEYARKTMSPVPWQAFSDELQRHESLGSAIFILITVTTVSLWCFWTAANLWNLHHPHYDKAKRAMTHAINALAGLIVTQPDNPLYRLINF